MVGALICFVLVTHQSRGVAFLDSLQTIHVPLDRPLGLEDLSPKGMVTVDGISCPIKSIALAGEPLRERRMPRTSGRVVLPGTIQGALGGKDWDPDGELTQMKETSPGIYELVVELPAGNYEYKVARNGSWDENYGVGFVPGGGNFHLVVPVREPVRFVVDFHSKTILDSIDNPSKVHVAKMARRSTANAAKLLYKVLAVNLVNPLQLKALTADIEVKVLDEKQRRVFARDVLDLPEFTYDGALGPEWSKQKTTFRVWSPVSSSAYVHLSSLPGGGAVKRISMEKGEHGLWTSTVSGNLAGAYYQYEFESYGEKRIAADIYCRSASRDSTWSQVVDLASTNPKEWVKHASAPFSNPVDAVIYELSVRDLTVSPTSGVAPEWRGKYLGLAENKTKSPNSHLPTGLEYLRQLGVTHLQILPVQDFLVSSPREYSWGYATCLFNVPEESFGTTPNDRTQVIREFKEMVSSIHQAGLRVVMDVVYNHTWPPQGKESPFWQAAPYYYFRTDLSGNLLNESGVGNALDDDRPMARKYVQDSLLYWQREFGIDGFRFDLLGMFQKSSVAGWVAALKRRDPNIIVYGEPWTGGGPTRFGKGVQRGLAVGVFNDDFRNVFRGDLDGSSSGFLAGGGADKDALVRAITGSAGSGGFALAPGESINYVSAHDNMTLFDRLSKSLSDKSLLPKALRFADAAVLLSQGVPFLEGGAELGRTKGFNGNSYDAGDAVNQFDWERGARFRDVSAYLAGLISIKKAEPGLRLRTAEEIRSRLRILEVSRDYLAFSIDESGLGGQHASLLVVLNGSKDSHSVVLPAGNWSSLIDGDRAAESTGGSIGHSKEIAPMTACLLAQ